ncbi:carbohydrate kinase family protein [Helcococcus sueciensis]|uniref:carbohydrate kinase family protein n=1 Tax=Helcococcus sueciensis TaxID=241555 RepID=UPI00041C4567|nr:carbohydrate kinase [Helcococcus sueciensis]
MTKIYTIGEMLIDFIPNKINCGLKDVESFTKMAGGAPANVAVAASKLGSEAYYVGMVGKDAFGDFLIDTVKSYGVKNEYIYQTEQANTSLAFVSLMDNGQREFSFYRNPGADMLLEEEHVEAIDLEKGDLISFCSVDLIEAPVKYATKRFLEKANEVGATVLFDPNLRFNLWNDLDELKEIVLEFVKYAQIIKISDDELEFITGHSDEEKAIEFIKNITDSNIIITRGSKGSYAEFGDFKVERSISKVEAIDTTGAGDAFVGGILNFIDKNKKSINKYSLEDVKDMLDFANRVAAYSVTKNGAMASYPSVEDL